MSVNLTSIILYYIKMQFCTTDTRVTSPKGSQVTFPFSFFSYKQLENGTERNGTEQNRTEQNRTEQNRTEQNRTEQNRTEQNRTGDTQNISAS
jgi:hypothetical protein